MGHDLYWGMPVILYLFMGGVGAGAVIVSGHVYHLAGAGSFGFRVARYGALIAPLPVILGTGLIIWELGRMYRVVNLFKVVNLSPMNIGSWLLFFFIILTTVYAISFLPWLSKPGDKWEPVRKTLAWACVPVGYGVAVYTVMLVGAFGMAPDTDIGQINLINYLWPIGVVLLSVWLLDEKPRIALTLGGVLLGFSGVAVSRGFDNVLRPPQSWLPLGMAFVAAMLWSGFCVLLRRWKVPETQNGMALHFTGCAILAALIALLTGGWERCFPMKPQTLFWVLFCGIGPVGLAYHWWEVGLKKGNIHLIAVLSFFIPIGSTLLLSLFFRLAINPGLYLGAVLIVLAAIFVRRATGER